MMSGSSCPRGALGGRCEIQLGKKTAGQFARGSWINRRQSLGTGWGQWLSQVKPGMFVTFLGFFVSLVGNLSKETAPTNTIFLFSASFLGTVCELFSSFNTPKSSRFFKSTIKIFSHFLRGES